MPGTWIKISGVLAVLLFILPSCVQREIKPSSKPAKIALVLGAGASRGFAHIGVLKVLESNNIPIHMIIGTSAGSFVGSLYAYGYNAFELQKMSFSMEKGDIIDWTIPDNGFIKGEKLEEFVNRNLNNSLIEQLKIPFYAIATDVQNGREIIFESGSAATAVRASCSIPGIFRPVRIGGRMYVDGGVVSPADIVIRPDVGNIASGDFSKKNEAVLEGEKAALQALPAINDLIARLRQEGRL
ncbi:MAG: patatin-like phospholipase family protein [Nitrospirae bacterium]|nr:patatin-like phospholipase family protein [Nitrospirota bacterium]